MAAGRGDRSYLEREGFEVQVVHDGLLRCSARDLDPDVVVLDLGLPGPDGIEVCRQLRTFSDAYVVMLTARTDEVDTLIGLSVGADDYMTKPFSPRELMARVPAMLRRPATGSTARESGAASLRAAGGRPCRPGRVAGWRAGPADPHRVRPARHPVPATRGWRSAAASSSTPCGVRWVGDEHLVDVHIGHLRRKLDDDAARADSSARCAASATGWAPANDPPKPPSLKAQGRQPAAAGSGFAARLLVAQALVLVAGAVPRGWSPPPSAPPSSTTTSGRPGTATPRRGVRHVEEAFASALLISLLLHSRRWFWRWR